METTCPNCRTPLRTQSKFCPKCGHAMVSPGPVQVVAIPCPHCQQAIRPGAKFCPHCGRTIGPPLPIISPTGSARARLTLWERRISLIIATLVLLLFLELALLVAQLRPVIDSTPTPNAAATLTMEASTPTPISSPGAAIPLGE